MIIELKKHDNYNVKVSTSGNTDAILDIDNYFSPHVDGYWFHPKYKMGTWDGKIRFFKKKSMTIPIGLLDELLVFLREKDYFAVLSDELKQIHLPEKKERNIELDNWFDSDGDKMGLYYYQKEAVNALLDSKFGIAVVGTGGGKMGGIISCIKGIFEEKPEAKVLVIAPRQQLIEQIYDEFETTGEDQSIVARLHGEQKEALKHKNPKVVISTWQSVEALRKKGKRFFELFEAVIVDEVHGARAVVLASILEAMTNTEWRLGFTGTMPPDRADKYTVMSNLGPVVYTKKSKALQDEGYISKAKVSLLGLLWKDEISFPTYHAEKDWLENNEPRNDFITKLVKLPFILPNVNFNALVLVGKIAHGKKLLEMMKENNMEAYFIQGSMKLSERERIKKLTDSTSNICIIATYGTFSTGINIKRLHMIVFAAPGKGEIQTVQSIGRGLRKSEDKDQVLIYDIFDNTKFSDGHRKQREQIYEDQEFPHKRTMVDMKEKTPIVKTCSDS